MQTQRRAGTGAGFTVRAVAEMLAGGPAVGSESAPLPAVPAVGVGAIVSTSGSTGAGKRVVLSRSALLAAAASSRAAVGLDLTWHLVLPSQYVAGLMVMVRSLSAGREPVLSCPDLSDLSATGDGDAVSIVGTQLYRALSDPIATGALAQFDLVLVGGAAVPKDLRDRATDARVALRETYGMSETCGGIVWDGHALPGSSIQLLDDARAPRGGRIALGGPTLCDGYLGDDGVIEPATSGGVLATADWGHMEHGRLVVDGRLDDVVFSGGVNVDLGALRRAVEAIDPDAAVLAVEDIEWGHRVVVFATTGSLTGWRDTLAPNLPRTALPRQLVRVPQIPRTPGGKPDRRALLALVPR